MSNKPKISVITPNFNHAHLLPDMLDTTLSQSYPPHEIILIDDGSTDDSLQVMERHAAQHPCIKILKNDGNKGITYSVNRGIHESTGDYLVFRSADDVSYPGFFEKSINLLIQHPNAGICCSDSAFFTKDYNNATEQRHGWSDTPRYFEPMDFARTLKGQFIYGSTGVVKKSAVLDVGCFLDKLNWSTDWFVMLASAFRFGVCYIPEVLAGNRYDKNAYAVAGCADDQKQSLVLQALIDYLRTDYRDILPHFALSGCMNVFGPLLADVLLSNPDNWNGDALALCMRSLWTWNQSLDAQHKVSIPTHIRVTLTNHINTIKNFSGDREPRIAIYGAGSHTNHLLQVWDHLELSPISEIIVSDTPSTSKFMGIPTRSIKNTSSKDYDAVILSSMSFEKPMSEACQEFIPTTPRLAIWDPRCSSPEFSA